MSMPEREATRCGWMPGGHLSPKEFIDARDLVVGRFIRERSAAKYNGVLK